MKYLDRIVAESGRAWFDKVGAGNADPFSLNGYGRVATEGGDALLDALIADVRRKIAPLDGQRLLEVGCGAGAMTAGLAAGTSRPVAIDFSHPMLTHARRRASEAFVVGDASRLPFASGCFDRVVCYSVFNNFPSHQFAEAVLDELIRVATRGATVLIGQVPNADRREDWQRAYAARFGQKESSALRLRIGSVKQRGLHLVRAGLALAGRRPTPNLHFQYYTAEFFQRIAARHSLRCEMLPAYNLLAEKGSHDVLADYRLDVKLTLPLESGGNRTP
jgi:ubiquinone/menaquinone biosynthesis C-methylase UbiE